MVKKKIKSNNEDELIKEIDGLFEFLAYALKYRTKELLSLLLAIAVIIILWQNISITSDKNGTYFEWNRAAEIKVNK